MLIQIMALVISGYIIIGALVFVCSIFAGWLNRVREFNWRFFE